MPRPASVAGGGSAGGPRPAPSWRRGLRRWRVRLGRWRNRDRERRGLLLRAAALVLAFRAALRVLPFSRVMAAVERMSEGGPLSRVMAAAEWMSGAGRGSAAGAVSPEAVGHEAEAAARHLAPGRPCLPQALACCVLLRRAGHPAELHIGVRRAPDDGDAGTPPSPSLQAHAWVECRGRVVAGGEPGEEASPRYTPLLARTAGRLTVGGANPREGRADPGKGTDDPGEGRADSGEGGAPIRDGVDEAAARPGGAR